ncbi:hypothetical protein ACQ86N_31925 [Puia sp. P3]|uniref:hypothetical protein n=1 Tax=Puia sp. P3 TaxID=3423952 RepID=UPI003D669172
MSVKVPTKTKVKKAAGKAAGKGVPVAQTCEKGFCYELEVSLNNDMMGIIRYGKSGWEMDLVNDQKLVDAIGAEIVKYFGEEPE